MHWMYILLKAEMLPRALLGHVELRVSGNWDRNICWGSGGSEIVHCPTGEMGKEILHVCRKAHRDGRTPSSVPEGKNHRLRVLCLSLPADPSAVDMDLYEAQTLADALKWYLQELPTPLIPPALYSDLVHMAQGKHTWAPPTPGTSVGLEKLWEAPRKASQHLQGGSEPIPCPVLH